MKLSIVGQHFLLDGHMTYTALSGFPDADPRLAGLLLNHRVVNGIYDDLNEDHDYDGDGRDDWAFAHRGEWDPDLNTAKFVEAMEHWREQGVTAFTIGLQGGNPFMTSPPPEGLSTRAIDCGAFNPDGSLRPAFLARLELILDRASELDMAPIINYFYQGGNRRIREDVIGAAVDNVTRWLLENRRDRLIIDLANECDSRAYWPALQLRNIHEMIYRVKDMVDLHSQRTGQRRVFYVGASLTGSYSVAESLSRLPESFARAVDLLLLHGNRRCTEEVRQAIIAGRARIEAATRRPMPIVYNEDIQELPSGGSEDVGGDLEHLEACLEADVSWGNLIRSHQRVPCEDWADGSEVQREWFRATSNLAGKPKPPSSVRKFHRRI